MRLVPAIVAVAITFPFATSRAETPESANCQETELPVQERIIESPDTYRAPNVEGVQRRVIFNKNANRRAAQILKVVPMYSAVQLDDGSAFVFIRDHRDGSIRGVRHVQQAACWADRFGFEGGMSATGEIILSDSPGRGRQLLRLENDNGRGKISVVWQASDSGERPNERIIDLIESKQPFHGFGVSPPSIEGGWRSLMTITQDNGSLIVGSYAYAIREENLPLDFLHRGDR